MYETMRYYLSMHFHMNVRVTPGTDETHIQGKGQRYSLHKCYVNLVNCAHTGIIRDLGLH